MRLTGQWPALSSRDPIVRALHSLIHRHAGSLRPPPRILCLTTRACWSPPPSPILTVGPVYHLPPKSSLDWSTRIAFPTCHLRTKESSRQAHALRPPLGSPNPCSPTPAVLAHPLAAMAVSNRAVRTGCPNQNLVQPLRLKAGTKYLNPPAVDCSLLRQVIITVASSIFFLPHTTDSPPPLIAFSSP
jgi:hypothetical protein